MSTFVDAFRFIGDNGHLILVKTGEHLELSLAALGIALALACDATLIVLRRTLAPWAKRRLA